MKKSLLYMYVLLLVFTLITALVSSSMPVSTLTVSLIMTFSVVKFLLVAFQFMELKKANFFWKMSLSLVVGFLFLVIVIYSKKS